MAKKREAFKEDVKWNVEDLYKDIKDFDDAYTKLDKSVENYKKYEGHILDRASNLLELLRFDRDFNKELEQLFIYAHLQNDQDTTNTF